MQRCAWVSDDPLYQQYHDEEWGRPTRDEQALFELLNLEGAQAGLSWITVLRKRARYREVFDGFDAERIAAYGPDKVANLLADPGIIRNKAKIAAAIGNARALLRLHASGNNLTTLLWDVVDGEPVVNHWASLAEVPASTPVSEAMSRRLKQAGFKFVGPTICYALMQSAGLVNDHTTDCFCHPQAGRPHR